MLRASGEVPAGPAVIGAVAPEGDATADRPALEVRELTAVNEAREARFVLAVERLQVRRCEALAIAGPSGAGKSTLLDVLAFARRPATAGVFRLTTRSGEIVDVQATWQRRDLDRLTGLRARHQGYVLQQGGLLPFLTVGRNIGLSQAVLGEPDRGRVAALAERLGLVGLLDRLPAELSAGQRQRVAIARALAHAPEIVLADEPTASLHPALADTVMSLLVEHTAAGDAALVLATHDPDRAARHGFEIIPIMVDPESGTGETRSRLAGPAHSRQPPT